jgi:hypothetical protein
MTDRRRAALPAGADTSMILNTDGDVRVFFDTTFGGRAQTARTGWQVHRIEQDWPDIYKRYDADIVKCQVLWGFADFMHQKSNEMLSPALSSEMQLSRFYAALTCKHVKCFILLG